MHIHVYYTIKCICCVLSAAPQGLHWDPRVVASVSWGLVHTVLLLLVFQHLRLSITLLRTHQTFNNCWLNETKRRTENSPCQASDSKLSHRTHLTHHLPNHLYNPVWHSWFLTHPGRLCNGPRLLHGVRACPRGQRWTKGRNYAELRLARSLKDSFAKMPGRRTWAQSEARGKGPQRLWACKADVLKSRRCRAAGGGGD